MKNERDDIPNLKNLNFNFRKKEKFVIPVYLSKKPKVYLQKAKGMVFPPKIFNLRVNTGIEKFFQSYKKFLDKLNYKHNFLITVDDERDDKLFIWTFGNLIIIGKEDDESVIDYFKIIVKGFPILNEITPKTKFSEDLIFRIVLPRVYPARVDLIVAMLDTLPFHPNVNPMNGKFGNYTFGGELESVLWDIIQMMLFDPERILPSTDREKAIDYALNKEAMTWYQTQDPHQLYTENINRLLNNIEKYT